MGTRLDNNGLATVLDKIKSWAEGKFVTDAGVTSFNGQTGAVTADIPSPSATTPNMDGTAAVGTATTYARGDHVHPSDTNKVDKVSGKGLSTNDYTTTEKDKLAGISEGAEANVQANWTETDSTSDAYILNKPMTNKLYTGGCSTAAGTQKKVVILDDETGFSVATGVRIAIRFTNANTHLSPQLSVRINSVDSTAKNIRTNPDATAESLPGWYANETIIFTYTGTLWVREPSSRNVVDIFDSISDKANKASPTFTGTPKAPTAAAGTNTTQIATTAFVTKAVSDAITGAASFKGTVNTSTDISNLSTYAAGQYWVVGTAGTYVGQSCEAGDMIYCIHDYSTAYSTSDFDVVQNNTEALTTTEINQIWNTVFNA